MFNFKPSLMDSYLLTRSGLSTSRRTARLAIRTLLYTLSCSQFAALLFYLHMETSSLDDEHSSRVLFSGPRNKWTAAFHVAFSSVPYYNQKKSTHQDRRYKFVQTKIKDWFGLHDGMTSHFSRPSTRLVLLFCSWLNQLVDIFFSVPEKRISTNSFTFVALTKTWRQKAECSLRLEALEVDAA